MSRFPGPFGATLPDTAQISKQIHETVEPNKSMLNTSDSVRSTRTEEGRILLDVCHGQMFCLNVVGSRILELIELGWDEARIAEEISHVYATTIEVARTDVHDFIDALRRHSILQANGPGDSF
jgi:hypothetical protein